MEIILEPTQPDQLDVTRTGEREWSVHPHGSHPVEDRERAYDNQAAAWHHAAWQPLHRANALPALRGTTRQLFAEEGSGKNFTADPRRAARVGAGEYDEGTAALVSQLVTDFIQAKINDPAHMTIYGEESPMTDETTEAEGQETPAQTQEQAAESPAGGDGATTPEDERQALRSALSESDRNAFDNYSHMAETAPSEQAREFWQAKADEVAANAA